MMAYASGDSIVVDGVAVASIVAARSGEREALLDALRPGIDLDDYETADRLREELESEQDENRTLRSEIDSLEDRLDTATAEIDRLKGEIERLSSQQPA